MGHCDNVTEHPMAQWVSGSAAARDRLTRWVGAVGGGPDGSEIPDSVRGGAPGGWRRGVEVVTENPENLRN